MASSPQLTLDELLRNKGLGLKVVVAGDLSVRVRGAHAMEIQNPARWLEPGWLLLTTGLRFLGDADPHEQADLIRELKAARVAGVAFGVDVNFPEVPDALVQAARQCELPLLTVAADVPFFQIESFINRSLAASETYLVKRALWLQTDLLQALSSERPLESLTNRIGSLIKGVAIIYDEAGSVVASTGAGPARLIWTEIRTRAPGRQRFLIGRWHVATRPTVLGGMGYWVAIGSQRNSVLDDLAEPVLDSSVRLLGAIRWTGALKATQARADANELLTLLSGGIDAAQARRLWERLAAFRFRSHATVRAFISTDLTNHDGVGSDDEKGANLDLLVEQAQNTGLPLIVRARESDDVQGLIGMAANNSVLYEWLNLLSASAHVGVSEPFDDLAHARRGFRDARRASLVAQRRTAQKRLAASARPDSDTAAGPLTGAVVRFEDVDLATWLLSSRSAEAILDKRTQQLGDLLDRPDLVETAVAFLASGFDIKRSAARLYLHPNSVRYRLKRIEEILDAPVNSPSTVANLYLAFHERLAAENGHDEPGEDA